MEFVRRSWDQIRTFLDRLDRNTRITIWAVLIAGMAITFIVLQYASAPATVTVTPFAEGRQSEVVAALRGAGIEAEVKKGQVVVPETEHAEALSVLQRSELLRADTSQAWNAFLSEQNAWETVEEKRKRFLIALQRSLSTQIGMHPDVRSAAVTISPEERSGFGQNFKKRSATISLVMQPGKKVGRKMAYAFADAVGGAVTGMRAQDVKVLDVNNGISISKGEAHEELPTDTLELVRAYESQERTKIEEFLFYIPGVIVGVNVQFDGILKLHKRVYGAGEKQPLDSESMRELISKDTVASAEPGVRPNTGLDTVGGGGSGSEVSETEKDVRFLSPQLQEITSTEHVGMMAEQINVSINVPRSFIVAEFMRGKPEGTAEPGDAELNALWTKKMAEIVTTVEPLVEKKVKGVVVASMIPDPGGFFKQFAPGGDEGMMGTFVSSGWAGKGFLGVLVALPLLMMMWMVRRATQQPSLPSVEELAGVPPTLPTEDDLVGEAAADEDSMAGVEVDEEELRFRKMAEQISEMVRGNPDEAGSLMGRWVGVDE